jgi:hypothetical protein
MRTIAARLLPSVFVATTARRKIMLTRKLSMLIVSVVLLLLGSCGGSGGDGIVVTPPPPAPPPANTAVLPITAANAQDITVTVLGAITSTIEIVDIVDVIGLPAVGGMIPGLAKLEVNAIIPRTVACDTGEANVSWDDADNNLEISTGDTFDIVFAMCFFADTGETLDGPTSLTNLVVEGDPFKQIAPWRFAATLGFDRLFDAEMNVLDGDLNLDISSDDNLVVNVSIATDLLVHGSMALMEELSNYELTQTLDFNAQTQSASANGTLTSSALEGSVTFETLQEFVGMFDDNPFTGQLLISDMSSSVLVTVIDNISVLLDIDLDLDGVIDQTIEITWAELDIE